MITFLKRFSPKRKTTVLSSAQGPSSHGIHDEVSSDDLQEALEAVQETPSGVRAVWIEPDSELTRSQSLLSKRKIDSEVFTIGRRGSGYLSSTYLLPDFALPQNEPFTVSKRHCEIRTSEDGIVICDMESRFGTIVDGIRLGGRRPDLRELRLGPGEHTLVIGPRDSSYRFRLIVE